MRAGCARDSDTDLGVWPKIRPVGGGGGCGESGEEYAKLVSLGLFPKIVLGPGEFGFWRMDSINVGLVGESRNYKFNYVSESCGEVVKYVCLRHRRPRLRVCLRLCSGHGMYGESNGASCTTTRLVG